VTPAFRAAVQATAETEWRPLIRMVDGQPQETDQEWAEICYVPNWAGYSRKRADHRFLAIREPLRQLPLGDQAQLPFPTQAFGPKGTDKLFGVVTNRKLADQVIWWLRERCCKSEEVHSVMKTDLAGEQLPSGRDLPKVPSGEAGWNGKARVIAALFQHLSNDCSLADVALADMLDRDPGFSGQRYRRLAHPLA
jgi:hypothetical protein